MNTGDLDHAESVVRLAARRDQPSLRLARVASLAVRLEPHLLRRLRLEFCPDLDVGVEADLWFGELVQGRSARFVVLEPAVAAVLRHDLVTRPRLAASIHATIAEEHRASPASIRLEERLNYLGLAGGDERRRDLNEALRPALRTLADGGEAAHDLAEWAVRAIPRLVPPALACEHAVAVWIAATATLGVGRVAAPFDADDVAVEDVPWVLSPELLPGPTSLWLTLQDDSVHVHSSGPDDQRVDVPATTPRLLELGWAGADGRRRVSLVEAEPGRSVWLGPDITTVTIRTLVGDQYRLDATGAGQPAHGEDTSEAARDPRLPASDRRPDLLEGAARHPDARVLPAERTTGDDAGQTAYFPDRLLLSADPEDLQLVEDVLAATGVRLERVQTIDPSPLVGRLDLSPVEHDVVTRATAWGTAFLVSEDATAMDTAWARNELRREAPRSAVSLDHAVTMSPQGVRPNWPPVTWDAAAPFGPVVAILSDPVVQDEAREPGQRRGTVAIETRPTVDTEPIGEHALTRLSWRREEDGGLGRALATIVRQHCPDSRIVSVPTFDRRGVTNEGSLTTALALLALRHLRARHGLEPALGIVDVVLLPFGFYSEHPDEARFEGPLRDVLVALGQLGVLVVVPAGDHATVRPMLPAGYAATDDLKASIQSEAPTTQPTEAPLLAVGALDPDDTAARYSNDGPWVTTWAAGEAAPHPSGDPSQTWSGTSAAAAHVAGLAAQAISDARPSRSDDGRVEEMVADAVDRAADIADWLRHGGGREPNDLFTAGRPFTSENPSTWR